MIGDSYDPSGKLIVKNQLSVFIVGAGNFGGKSQASDAVKPAIPAPNRPCDASIKYTTTVDQAALYRYDRIIIDAKKNSFIKLEFFFF